MGYLFKCVRKNTTRNLRDVWLTNLGLIELELNWSENRRVRVADDRFVDGRRPTIARERTDKRYILGMRPIQLIGLIAGIVIGAVFAHFEYDQWFYGALVGSGLGPIIAFVLQRRFDS